MQNFVCILLFCFSSQIDLKIHVDETWQQWHVHILLFIFTAVSRLSDRFFISLDCQ